MNQTQGFDEKVATKIIESNIKRFLLGRIILIWGINMCKLSKLPNVGKVIEKRLNSIGIYTWEELVNTGSKEAFFLIKIFDNTACLHMLYALQGAIEGKRYTQLSESTKEELKQFFNKL